jgi:hypothetical protein
MSALQGFGARLVSLVLRPFGLELRRSGMRHPEVTADERALMNKYRSYTMTPEIRQWTLLKAIEYADRNDLVGDVVECGVWRGGNVMMSKEYRNGSSISRRFWLYDTFAGMTEPTEHDITPGGNRAMQTFLARRKADHTDWAYASLEEVRSNFEMFGLLDDSVVFRKGMVEDTLPTEPLPDQIAVLRLDTDWYESTLVELQVLYPRLVQGGVLIVDDFGDWLGAKKAVDEYFDGRPPLLMPVDTGCRMAVKT